MGLILDKTAYGWSPEELQYQHPHLTLGQIYSALAYYSDHQEEFDKEIEKQLRAVRQMRKLAKLMPLEEKLRGKKKILTHLEEEFANYKESYPHERQK